MELIVIDEDFYIDLIKRSILLGSFEDHQPNSKKVTNIHWKNITPFLGRLIKNEFMTFTHYSC